MIKNCIYFCEGPCEEALVKDELVRCTDVKKVTDLTQSQSLSNFKTAFCRIKDLRELLERHCIDLPKLWTTNPPEMFAFVPRNSELIKLKVK